jgi:ATP-dependent DNA helicase RecG
MLSRNPELHFVFARMGMAEEQGLCLGSLRDKAAEFNLPLPKYALVAPYLELTIFRSKQAAIQTLKKELPEELSKAEERGWEWLSTQRSVTAREYETAMDIPRRTALNHLKHFAAASLILPAGSGPSTRYNVIGG